MAIDINGNGMAYLHTVGTVAEYEVKLAGERMLIASVDEADPFLRIRVRSAHLTGAFAPDIKLRFSAQMNLHAYGDGEDVQVKEHVDGVSVAHVIIPLLPWLILLVNSGEPTVTAINTALNLIYDPAKV